MFVETFIQMPNDDHQYNHHLFSVQDQGAVYFDYPNGPGEIFAALFVKHAGDRALVYEVADAGSMELGFKPFRLPEGTPPATDVDEAHPFERSVVHPLGYAGSLIVRYVGAGTFSAEA